MLAMLVLVNPGDEVIVFDPYFVMYDALASVAGGQVGLRRHVSRFPHRPGPRGRRDHAADEGDHLQQPGQSHRRGGRRGDGPRAGRAGRRAGRGAGERRDLSRRSATTSRSSRRPSSTRRRWWWTASARPTGCPAGGSASPTGRAAIIQRDDQAAAVQLRLRAAPLQWAGAAAMDVDMTPQIEAYRRKRDMIVDGLADDYELVAPGRGVLRLSESSPGAPARSSSPRRSRDTNCWSFPATSSAAATPTSASPTPPTIGDRAGIEALWKLARSRP